MVTRSAAGLFVWALFIVGASRIASANSCALGGGSVPDGWTLNGTGGGVNAAAPLLPPNPFTTVCYIVTDSGGGWPGFVSTGFPMSGVPGDPNVPVSPDTGIGTTNGSEMLSPPFAAAAGQRLIFDFMFATNDGTSTYSDWANVVVAPVGGGPVLNLFTARTGDNNQVVPGYGFSSLAPGLVLTPGTASLRGDTWCLNALTGGTSCSDPDATVYGPVRYPDSPPPPGAVGGSSDWNHAVFTFDTSSAGSYRMVMNVANVGDEIYSSALFFAGASISGGDPIEPAETDATAEPGTLALFGSGLIAVGAMLRWRVGKKSPKPGAKPDCAVQNPRHC
jgi:hypothetical protein